MGILEAAGTTGLYSTAISALVEQAEGLPTPPFISS